MRDVVLFRGDETSLNQVDLSIVSDRDTSARAAQRDRLPSAADSEPKEQVLNSEDVASLVVVHMDLHNLLNLARNSLRLGPQAQETCRAAKKQLKSERFNVIDVSDYIKAIPENGFVKDYTDLDLHYLSNTTKIEAQVKPLYSFVLETETDMELTHVRTLKSEVLQILSHCTTRHVGELKVHVGRKSDSNRNVKVVVNVPEAISTLYSDDQVRDRFKSMVARCVNEDVFFDGEVNSRIASAVDFEKVACTTTEMETDLFIIPSNPEPGHLRNKLMRMKVNEYNDLPHVPAGMVMLLCEALRAKNRAQRGKESPEFQNYEIGSVLPRLFLKSPRNLDNLFEVPSGFKVIGEKAFQGAEMTEIRLPPSITTIEDYAFRNSTLKYVFLPRRVRNLGPGAFENCFELRRADLSDGIQTIGNMAFMKCQQLKDVTIRPSITTIGASAFHECVNLNIPMNLKDYAMNLQTLGDHAFQGSGLTEVTLGSLQTIGDGVFKDCQNLTQIVFSGTERTGTHTCENCSKLKTITLEEGLETIDEAAFRNCSSLEAISLPNSLKVIEKEAFKDCINLTSVTLQKQADIVIHKSAFKNTGVTVRRTGGIISPTRTSITEKRKPRTKKSQVSPSSFAGARRWSR